MVAQTLAGVVHHQGVVDKQWSFLVDSSDGLVRPGCMTKLQPWQSGVVLCVCSAKKYMILIKDMKFSAINLKNNV